MKSEGWRAGLSKVGNLDPPFSGNSFDVFLLVMMQTCGYTCLLKGTWLLFLLPRIQAAGVRAETSALNPAN
jgi:hypothetical protein